ncbi:MAG: hypothetical protein NT109_04140 [Flavobacteriia bacterium]|nr:hypothetical protein [Flavobacteriia bacterium]
MLKKSCILFVLFYTYAAIRYHIGKNLGQEDFLFVLNKAFAWTAGTYFTLTLAPKIWFPKIIGYRRQFGFIGYGFGLLHLVCTIFLISPSNYPLLFNGSQLNIHGYQIIAFGIINLCCFSLPLFASFRKFPEGNICYKFGRIGIYSTIIHVTTIGIQGWFFPQQWPYFLPPITLLYVLTASGLIIIRAFFIKELKPKKL